MIDVDEHITTVRRTVGSALLEFPSPEPGIVSISTGVESLYVEDDAYVERHTLIFDAVHTLALDPKRSVDLIESVADEHDEHDERA